jgi:hypothetical protein
MDYILMIDNGNQTLQFVPASSRCGHAEKVTRKDGSRCLRAFPVHEPALARKTRRKGKNRSKDSVSLKQFLSLSHQDVHIRCLGRYRADTSGDRFFFSKAVHVGRIHE